VKIKDAPLDLGSADLEVALSLEPDAQEWSGLVASQRSELINAFLGGDAPEDMLLGAMSSVYAGDPQEFETASTTWASDIAAHLSLHGVELASTLTTLIDDGLLSEPAEITGAVSGVANAPDHAVFTLQSFGSATPAQMQVPAEYVTSFTADPNDTVRLGGTLFWMPSRYLAYVAEQEGHAQYIGHNDFAEVLGEVAYCEDLVLTGLPMCTDQCIVDLCVAALAERWSVARASSAATLRYGELPFESSGKSRFDDAAVVTGFSGTWLGELVAGADRAVVSGLAEANEAGVPPE
jgi:hypothetical protein